MVTVLGRLSPLLSKPPPVIACFRRGRRRLAPSRLMRARTVMAAWFRQLERSRAQPSVQRRCRIEFPAVFVRVLLGADRSGDVDQQGQPDRIAHILPCPRLMVW